MRWIYMTVDFFGGEQTAAATACMILLILLSAGVGFAVKSAGIYAALALTTVCGGGLFFLLFEVKKDGAITSLAITGLTAGICYAFLFFALTARRKILERRLYRAEIKRQVQFTLPDKENGYLRDRLRTALHTAEIGGINEELFGTDKKNVGIRLGYARKMLAKVKEAPLSPAERLDVEEMARLIFLYEKREKWSSSELKTVNEIFSRLLKLSAKYELAI